MVCCMAQDTDAGTVWLTATERETLNKWMDAFEDREGFEPRPGQAVASACTTALEVEQ